MSGESICSQRCFMEHGFGWCGGGSAGEGGELYAFDLVLEDGDEGCEGDGAEFGEEELEFDCEN